MAGGRKRTRTSSTKTPAPAQPGVSGDQAMGRPPLAQHDSTVLDLAFAMDCTGTSRFNSNYTLICNEFKVHCIVNGDSSNKI